MTDGILMLIVFAAVCVPVFAFIIAVIRWLNRH